MKSLKDIQEEAAAKRRKDDNVEELIKTDGFHDVYGGRSGTIYYVDAGQLCELYYELSGDKQFEIIIEFKDLSDWLLPTQRLMTDSEKKLIRHNLNLWLDREGIKAKVY